MANRELDYFNNKKHQSIGIENHGLKIIRKRNKSLAISLTSWQQAWNRRPLWKTKHYNL